MKLSTSQLFVLCLAVINILAVSCKKDKHEEPEQGDARSAIIPGTDNCLLTKYYGGDGASIEYDSKHRPIKVKDTGNGIYTTTITYNQNDIFLEYDHVTDRLDQTIVYKVGTNGLITSYTRKFKASGIYADEYIGTEIVNNFYDKEEYLIRRTTETTYFPLGPDYSQVFADGDYETVYSYVDGNLVSEESPGNKVTYEYYTDKPNNMLNYFQPDVVTILNFLSGRPNKNLLKKSTRDFDPDQQITEYSYEFNGEGLVSKQSYISTSRIHDIVFTRNYDRGFDYACN